MHITQETDYALRIVFCLASKNKRLDARTISEEMSVPLRFSLKILGKLSQCEIVQSYKGNKGGYELKVDSSKISLLKVMECVEGRYLMSRCIEDEVGCTRGADSYCSFKKVFTDITKEISEKLDAISFKSLIE